MPLSCPQDAPNEHERSTLAIEPRLAWRLECRAPRLLSGAARRSGHTFGQIGAATEITARRTAHLYHHPPAEKEPGGEWGGGTTVC